VDYVKELSDFLRGSGCTLVRRLIDSHLEGNWEFRAHKRPQVLEVRRSGVQLSQPLFAFPVRIFNICRATWATALTECNIVASTLIKLLLRSQDNPNRVFIGRT
jgi:hypothetical protein